jgi:hypothetical protein
VGNQLSLFETDGPVGAYGTPVAPATNGTPTSNAAADAIAPVSGAIRRKVLDFVRDAGSAGATSDEIERGLGLGGSTVRPRLVELRVQHRIEDSGRTRPTASGRAAVVWRVAN